MRLTIDMPWGKDLSVNHCRMGPRGNWHIKSHVESWMERLAWELVYARRYGAPVSGIPPVDFSLPIRITVDFRYPDKRKRDDHNYGYCIANAVASGLKIDDKDIRISTGTIEIDRDNPGFTITVEDSE